MHVYRDTASPHEAVTSETDHTLKGLISKRLRDLADYEEPLFELVQILVIEPSDASTQVEADLGLLGLCHELDAGRVPQREAPEGFGR